MTASQSAPAGPHGPGLLHPTAFHAIAGWHDDDQRAALQAFLISARHIADAPPKPRALGISGEDLQAAARALLAGPTPASAADARSFFETWFVPHRIASAGFVTGYYEPEVAASRGRTARFPVPLYRRPPDLVEVSAADAPQGWDAEMRFARLTPAGIRPFFDRPQIEAGALAGQGLELAWVESPVDAFFIHVQGSARLALGGEVMRISFDGKSGHAYTSIGRLAVERGLLPRERADKDGLEAWLRANPDAGAALMRENRSFIFFREVELGPDDGPLGAAGVPLTAGRSLAVDRTLMTFHAPVWVDVPELRDPATETPFRRLMIAQDTGSAIVGPARGDLFFGSGAAAGSAAGRVRHAAEMIALVPRRSAG